MAHTKGSKRNAGGKAVSSSKTKSVGSKNDRTKHRSEMTTSRSRSRNDRKRKAPSPAKVAKASEALSAAPRHILVFVPGFMGSQLRNKKTNELVWLDLASIPKLLRRGRRWVEELYSKMRYPENDLYADKVIEEVVVARPLFKSQQYGRLFQTLRDWGYRIDPKNPRAEESPVYTFAYDWRKDIREAASELAKKIPEWRKKHNNAPVWLVGHSGGGIVSRWCIQKELGLEQEHVTRLFLLASPWDGSSNALAVLWGGLHYFVKFGVDLMDWGLDPFGIARLTRDGLRTFPSAYELVPQKQDFLTGTGNTPINPFDEGTNWLDDPVQRDWLVKGRAFNQELGNKTNVETIAFFGRSFPTRATGVVSFHDGKHWSDIEWALEPEGDGTVREYSAIHPGAKRNIPAWAEHGDIYTNEKFLQDFKWELLERFGSPEAQAKALEAKAHIEQTFANLDVEMDVEREIYAPGTTIAVAVTLKSRLNELEVEYTEVAAALEWVQALPGSGSTRKPGRLPNTQLAASSENPTRFVGSFAAPKKEGYYRLIVEITLPFEKPISLAQSIVVQSIPRMQP